MDRGRAGSERKATSRIGRSPDPGTRRHAPQGAGKSPTSRVQRAGAGRGEEEERGGRGQQQAPPADNKTTLYLGIGGGALVFAIIIAFAMMGGESSSGGGGGGNADSFVSKAINQATMLHQRGEYRQGLDVCEEALKDPRSRRSQRTTALQALANTLRGIVNLDRDAEIKVAEFSKKIEAAKAAGEAMKRANEFWGECNTLLNSFGTTTSAKKLRDIKEDLRRWVATESQGDWQKDYNVTKARIEKSMLGEQKFAEAIREWHRFGEISQDPLLHSRIEQEVRTVNQQAQAAAEKVVSEAGAGAEARTKLEEAQARFNGTDGLVVINKALKGLK